MENSWDFFKIWLVYIMTSRTVKEIVCILSLYSSLKTIELKVFCFLILTIFKLYRKLDEHINSKPNLQTL